MHLNLPHPAQTALRYAVRHPIRAFRERREGEGIALGEVYDPEFDFVERPDGWALIGDVPGLRERDLDIRFDAGLLVVSGEREAEQVLRDAQLHVQERSWGRFSRSFSLPEDADPELADADLEDGVLTVRIPRKARELHKIPIRES